MRSRNRGARFPQEISDDHPGAGGNEGPDDTGAEPARPARDDRNLPANSLHIRLSRVDT